MPSRYAALPYVAFVLALLLPAVSYSLEPRMPENLLRVKQLAVQMALQRAGEALIRSGHVDGGFLHSTLRVTKVLPSTNPRDIRVTVQTDVPGVGLLWFRGSPTPSEGRPFSLVPIANRLDPGARHGRGATRPTPFRVELVSGCSRCSGCKGNATCATSARVVPASPAGR
jgi:hypothetical protein